MGRRSDHSRDELREMAIAAGHRMISEEGFSAFSARKVAREIGYTIGTIYNIFESHEHFILHINAVTLAKMHDYIQQRVVQGTSCTESMKNLADSYVTFAREHYHCWSALFEFNFPNSLDFPGWYAQRLTDLFLMVEAPLQDAYPQDKEAVERTAKVLWAGIHGICQLGLNGSLDTVGAESMQVLTDTLVETYMRGMEP